VWLGKRWWQTDAAETKECTSKTMEPMATMAMLMMGLDVNEIIPLDDCRSCELVALALSRSCCVMTRVSPCLEADRLGGYHLFVACCHRLINGLARFRLQGVPCIECATSCSLNHDQTMYQDRETCTYVDMNKTEILFKCRVR